MNWENLARSETLVILMGVKYRSEIAKRLIEFGKTPSERVVFVENATNEGERIIFSTLEEVANNPPDIGTPALFIVGPTVEIGLQKITPGSPPICDGGMNSVR